MKIFEEGDMIRLQLKDMKKNQMLFDFSIARDLYPELKNHIIKYLNEFVFNKEVV